MKRQSIFLILLLLQVLFICAGCSSSRQESETTAGQQAVDAENAENVENIIGIFEGLEDNHTAVFSFEGAEEAFYFEDSAVQQVLYEAVAGSHYTLSYRYDSSLGYVIYEISE